jgi:ribosomal protein L11 methyltransferase
MKKPVLWIEIIFSVSPELSEVLSSIIFEETGQGSFWEENSPENQGCVLLKTYLPKDEKFRENLINLKKKTASLRIFFPDYPAPGWNLRLIFEENWQENWKKFFRPLRVCSNLIICPSWENYEPKSGETLLRLDPGQAFGTGSHASTHLCLEIIAFLAADSEEKTFLFSRVLDVGTGSGILAMAAATFQAGSVLAIDNDPLAVEAARAHVHLNKLEPLVQVRLATPQSITGPFSLILANLTLGDLVSLAPVLKGLLSPKAILVTSGFLQDQARSLIGTFLRHKLAFLRLHLQEDWGCALFQAAPS